MYSMYNFYGSWQLIPEKSVYTVGVSPKSMICKIDDLGSSAKVDFSWFTHESDNVNTNYLIATEPTTIPFQYHDIADEVTTTLVSNHEFYINAIKDGASIFENKFEISPKGLLIITQKYKDEKNIEQVKIDTYHKQLSVLPYAHSVSGVAIIPTSEGTIKHKALQAMAEQTDMHLDQIRKQIELLALQANEIKRRKELSMMIYDAKINFVPQIGQVYHLYEKRDGTHTLSLVAPKEWGGGSGPYQAHLGGVKLLADHTWTEVE
jgi:hypothetical protein